MNGGRTANPTKLPGFPKVPSDASPAQRAYLTAIAEALEVRLGRRGDPRDAAVTYRDLIDGGLAVEGLTVSLAAEFAPSIRVNCIAPSLTNSKIAEPMLKNKALADGIAKAHPLKRLGEGKDSASLAKFLMTEDSSWMTGQIIAVDGGRSKLS